MIANLLFVALLAPNWADVGDALHSAPGIGLVSHSAPARWQIRLGLDASAPPADQAGHVLVQAEGGLGAPAGQKVAVPANEVRATRRFLRQWREAPATPERLIGWIDHPAWLARRLSLGVLARHYAQGHSPSEEAVTRLLDQLTEPGVARQDRRAALDALAAGRDPRAADALAERFEQIDSDRLRAAAAGTLARANTPTTRAALLHCAKTGRPLVRRRCLRLLERSKVRGALTPGARQP